MTTFPYTCKFCGKPGTVEADEAGLVMFKPEVWLPKMVCNRCGKFMEEKRRHVDTISAACRVLQTARTSLNGEKVRGLETQTKLKLEVLTKRFATLVCEYYRVQNVWDYEFTEILFDKPDSVNIAVGVYIRGIAAAARPRQQQLGSTPV